jgi:hypothetical protein
VRMLRNNRQIWDQAAKQVNAAGVSLRARNSG